MELVRIALTIALLVIAAMLYCYALQQQGDRRQTMLIWHLVPALGAALVAPSAGVQYLLMVAMWATLVYALVVFWVCDQWERWRPDRIEYRWIGPFWSIVPLARYYYDRRAR